MSLPLLQMPRGSSPPEPLMISVVIRQIILAIDKVAERLSEEHCR